MAASKGMSNAQLTALVDRHVTDALDFDSSSLKAKRELTLQFLNGEVDIPAEEGKSSVVSHDMADTLNAVLPGLLKVFLSTDRVMVYEPRRPEFKTELKRDLMTGVVMPVKRDISAERAKQATDYANYVFISDCGGYSVLYSALHSGLAHGNGIIKHWWDSTPETVTETRRGLSEESFIKLVSDPNVEVLEHTAYPDDSIDEAEAAGEAPEGAMAAGGPGVPPVPGAEVQGMGPAAIPGMGAPQGAGSGGSSVGPQDAPGMGGPNNIQPSPGTAPAEPPVGLFEGGGGPNGGAGPLGAPLAGLGLPALPPMLHDVRIRRTVSTGRLMIRAVPDEEFMISRTATALTEKDCGGFVGHYYRETRSELIKQGYDYDTVMELGASQNRWDVEKQVREELIDTLNAPTDGDESLELVDVYECYVQCDYDGDGVAEWRQIIMAGGIGNRNILSNEEWDGDLPFTDLVPEPVPFRWRGRSIGDDTVDIQRLKTAIWRQMMDNLYKNNNQQTVVRKDLIDPQSIDALINQELGGVIFVKGPGAIEPLVTPYVADKAFQMLEYADAVTMKRTGVNQQDKSLDADTLQNVSATASNNAVSAAHAKIETYARNVAEVGMKRLASCILKLICNNADRPRTIRLRGEWVEFDPRQWDPDLEVTINTGLGTGSQDRDAAALMQILQIQQQFAQLFGPANPVAGIDKIVPTIHKLIETRNLKGPEQYVGEPPKEWLAQLAQPKPPAPDPKIMAQMQLEQAKMQANSQAEQTKLQSQMQFEQQKAQMEFAMRQKEAEFNQQMEAARAQRDAAAAQANLDKQTQIERMQAEADIAVKQREAEMKMEMERQKMAHQMQLAEQKFAFEKELKLMEHHMKAQAMQPPVDVVAVSP